MDELLAASAVAQGYAVRCGEVSSEELTRAHLERIAAVEPGLGAVVHLVDCALDEARERDSERAAGRSRGPLHGVPLTLKDSHDVAGVLSTGGTEGRRAFRPLADSPPVARLRAAGAVVIGRTNTPELTLSFLTENLLYGASRNPWDLDRSPGGSSGGAAAALAVGATPLELGSDLGGSVRVPAAYCGVAGLKPTPGRVPRTGHVFPGGGHLDHFGTIGPMSRHVQDLYPALRLIEGPDGVDPSCVPLPTDDPAAVEVAGLRVAMHIDNGCQAPDASVRGAVIAAAGALEAAGALVVPVCPPLQREAWALVVLAMEADLGATFRRLLTRCGTTRPSRFLRPYIRGDSTEGLVYARRILAGAPGPLSPTLTRILRQPANAALTVGDLTELLCEIDRVRSGLLGFMQSWDAILGPVSVGPAPKLEQAGARAYSFVGVHNLSGSPALVVRAGYTPTGLPLAVQIAAHPWRDDVALRLGQVVEAAAGPWRSPALAVTLAP